MNGDASSFIWTAEAAVERIAFCPPINSGSVVGILEKITSPLLQSIGIHASVNAAGSIDKSQISLHIHINIYFVRQRLKNPALMKLQRWGILHSRLIGVVGYTAYSKA